MVVPLETAREFVIVGISSLAEKYNVGEKEGKKKIIHSVHGLLRNFRHHS